VRAGLKNIKGTRLVNKGEANDLVIKTLQENPSGARPTGKATPTAGQKNKMHAREGGDGGRCIGASPKKLRGRKKDLVMKKKVIRQGSPPRSGPTGASQGRRGVTRKKTIRNLQSEKKNQT